MAVSPGTKRVMRGVIIKLIYQKHESQEESFRDWTLMEALDQLSFKVYLNLVHELLQGLSDAGFVKYREHDDPKTGDTVIAEIQLTHSGRKIAERVATDSSISM